VVIDAATTHYPFIRFIRFIRVERLLFTELSTLYAATFFGGAENAPAPFSCVIFASS
jgi:hypothetical protein